MKNKKHFTKQAMVFTSVRLKQSDIELMRVAAAREGISRSEFFRVAINERARRVLLEGEQQQNVA